MLAKRAAGALSFNGDHNGGERTESFSGGKAQISGIVLSQSWSEFAVGRWRRLVVFVYSASTRWVLWGGGGRGEGAVVGANVGS